MAEQDGDRDDRVATEAEVGRRKVKVIWREGQGGDYRVFVLGDRQWSSRVSHRFEGGYLQLVFPPGPGGVPAPDAVIVISQGTGRPAGQPGADPQAILDEPGAHLLEEIQLGNDELIIAISRTAIGEISYADQPDGRDVILTAADPARPAPEDLIVRRGDDLNVSFPHWEDGIAKVSYLIDEDRLDIVVIPGDEGLKFQDADVTFSRGAELPAIGQADIDRVRSRDGIFGTRFTVSLPYQEGTVEKVSYQLTENCLVIIIRPPGDWSFDPADIRFSTSPIPDDDDEDEDEDEDDDDDDE
jgi:hypothetical protein